MIAATPQKPNGTDQQTPFVDPAFDPQDGFDFSDASDEVSRSMHDKMASLNVFNQGFNSVARHRSQSLASFDPFSVGFEIFTGSMDSSIDPSNMYADDASGTLINVTGHTAYKPTPQSSLIQGRNDSVVERFGQITPPHHTSSRMGEHKSSADSLRRSKVPKLSKSERARDAANSRHAKSRRARARSGSAKSIDSSQDGEEVVKDKREKYREKNRVAAAKCRAKKKDSVDILEERHRQLSADYNFLRRTGRALRDEYSMLRTLALQHTSAVPDCTCTVLHRYNAQSASQVAYGLTGPIVSSPSEGILSPSMHGPTSRTNST
ncbi:hypothetical protein LTR53_000031 [Teratosphaeriaceae sp. CCFEE 6253]|nr:hypothetical protein LTR53_000031 [Teratosphaeriaceae sp. CCFEE 6253]